MSMFKREGVGLKRPGDDIGVLFAVRDRMCVAGTGVGCARPFFCWCGSMAGDETIPVGFQRHSMRVACVLLGSRLG